MPRCKQSTFVDKHDFEAAKTIVCPLPDCPHIWCKACQQSIQAGGPQHSCDGSSELDHLMKERGWKYCPSRFPHFFPLADVLMLCRLQDTLSEGDRLQSHDGESPSSLVDPIPIARVLLSACHRDATPISATSAGKPSLNLRCRGTSKLRPRLIMVDVTCLMRLRTTVYHHDRLSNCLACDVFMLREQSIQI